MIKLIIITSIAALCAASVTYAATKAISVDSTAIYLKDNALPNPIISFQDGQAKCYIYSAPQAYGSISCVALTK